NDIDASDTAQVDLFVPDISVTKSVTPLISKVTDTVSYTVVISNDSSSLSLTDAQIPDLVLETALDTLVGELLVAANANVSNFVNGCGLVNATLAETTCTITYDYVIQAGDDAADGTTDGVVNNTVSVESNPAGAFTNDIDASDTAAVELFVPAISVTKSVNAISKVGDDVHYVITISNDSSSLSLSDALIPNLVFDAISDTIAGDLLTPTLDPNVSNFVNNCGASMAESPPTCTITYDYTIQAVDDVASDSEDGAGLGTCGDSINNVPAQDAVADAADPDCAADGIVDNKVSVESHPSGFTNDVDASNTAQVKLFVPGINVTKDCTPATVAVGDTVSYTCTIQNTSTSLSLTDTEIPALVFDAINDTLAGDLLTPSLNAGVSNFSSTCGASLAAGASCTITYDRVIQAADDAADGTADATVTNTVSVESHPDGFTNDVDDSDSCSVQIVGCALSPGFWGGGSGRGKWDQTADPIAASAGFTTGTCFPWVSSSIQGTGSGPAGCITYLDTLQLSGSDVTIQLSFKYIAARLNQAACDAGVAALCAPGSIGLNDLLGQVEDYFDGVGTGNLDDEAGGDFNPNPDDTNTDDQFAVPVGSNPPCKGAPAVKAACVEGKRLFNLLNSYFSTVGEQFCPLPSSIPEA
ncbi:MAG: hypothetical protein Q8Q00_07835, partial [Dehalococcoidia bacterium]|nr:hypothetical protein [Dehalococcoidia bacterium]